MSFCSNCGKQLAENEVCTCRNEGKVETVAPTPQPQPQPETVYVQAQPAYNLDAMVEASPKYKPISMWGYFGYQLLFCIPCVGIIMLIVFAFGGGTNVNLKNFARSYFCMLIIGVILAVILFVLFSSFLSIAEFTYVF